MQPRALTTGRPSAQADLAPDAAVRAGVCYAEAVRRGMHALLDCPDGHGAYMVPVTKDSAHRGAGRLSLPWCTPGATAALARRGRRGAGVALLMREMQARGAPDSASGKDKPKAKSADRTAGHALRSARHAWLQVTDAAFWADRMRAPDDAV